MKKNENYLNHKHRLGVLMLFVLIIQIFFTERQCQFYLSLFGIIKRIICFSLFYLIFEMYVGHISIYLMYKTLRAIVGLFLSNVFEPSIFDGYFILSQLYFFTNVFIFETLSECNLIPLRFNATIDVYWKHSSFPFLTVALFFYLVLRINIWTTMFKIYFVAFVIQNL